MTRETFCGQQRVTTMSLRPGRDYVDTPAVRALSERAFSYLQAGFPLHLRGPAGSGKTSLAFRLAAQTGRPTMFLTGDASLTTGDLIGKQNGFQHRKVVDRFIHSVLKYEENVEQTWADSKLTIACREGYTLVYDEFTRSRAEANNVLLGVLEEGLLVLPCGSGGGEGGGEIVKVHPDFRIIFTSNPQEYAGVHSSQDALNDRMITIEMDYFDEETEIAISAARSGLDEEAVAPIVRLVRGYRASGQYQQIPTPRASIMIAKMAGLQGLSASAEDERFVQLCLDVLEGKCARVGKADGAQATFRRTLLGLIEEHCNGKEARQPRNFLRNKGNGAGAGVNGGVSA
jgi:nitric oxide reductase NorQ protein